jgi:hypothetical protein
MVGGRPLTTLEAMIIRDPCIGTGEASRLYSSVSISCARELLRVQSGAGFWRNLSHAALRIHPASLAGVYTITISSPFPPLIDGLSGLGESLTESFCG